MVELINDGDMIAMKATLCLSDIPKQYIRQGADGKKYLDVYIGQRRSVSKYGKTHYIKVDLPQNYEAAFVGEAKQLSVSGSPHPDVASDT
jgi:hypothetical protein